MNNATEIKATANGTINRATLRKLVAAGKIEARIYLQVTDHGTLTDTAWLPARFSRGYEDNLVDFVNLDESDFDSSSGRAYKRDDGRTLLRIHSNLVFEVRIAGGR